MLTNMLTDQIVADATPRARPYKLFDGRGLYLFVSPTGAKSFRLKYRYCGKEKTLTFGAVGLAEARRLTLEARDVLRSRGDPSPRHTYEPQTLPDISELPLPKTGPCRVYFIQATSGHIKVGVARDTLSRVASLQTSHPEPLKILGEMRGGYAHELYVHRLFHEDRRNGEWFKPSQRLLDFIADNADRPRQC